MRGNHLRYRPSFLAVFISIIFFSCSPQKAVETVPTVFLKKALTESIENTLADTSQKYNLQDTLLQFYANRKFKPLWFKHIKDDSLRNELFNFVNQIIESEGLFLSPFDADSIKNWLPDTPYVYNEEFYAKMAKAEIVISSTLVYLHKGQNLGFTNPKEVFDDYYDLPTKEHDNFKLFAVLNTRKFEKTLEKGKMQDTTYLKYKLVLDSLRKQLHRDTLFVRIDTAGIRKIEVGDTTSILPLVANNLMALGIINEKQAAKADPFIYNKAFLPYIRKAQTAFGLHDDGIIGRNTIKFFNQTNKLKMQQVQLNMERERWIERPEEPPFVMVNLPEYKLYLHYIDSTKVIKVCIGKPRAGNYDSRMEKYRETGNMWDRPRDFETPQIHSKIEYFVLNPTWVVPRSIVVREMYHQMRRDSAYLRDNHYTIYYKGEELNPDTINWRQFKPTKIPFRFVQTWGEHNALGKVKYIFRNKHHIYFHDTPQQSRFKWTQRSVSHGCVRLADPMLFGEFVLKEHKDYNYDDFRIFLGMEPLDEERLEEYDPADTTAEIQALDGTKIIHLTKTIPVYFLYRTVWFDEDGKAIFNADIYQKNEELIKAVNDKMANLPLFN